MTAELPNGPVATYYADSYGRKFIHRDITTLWTDLIAERDALRAAVDCLFQHMNKDIRNTLPDWVLEYER